MKTLEARFRRGLATAATIAFVTTLAACGDAAEDAQPEIDTGAEAAAVDTAAPAETGMEQEGMAALVDPNTATEEELMAVPGLDSAAVATVLEGRPFETMLPLHEQLSARMDSAALDELYRHMFIPLDLNAASEEEILLIPGVGARMAYELEEYRPYEAMAQFRREMGKYVDDAEVARLEQYVRIN
jgi:DNA uptake protein ComE-like DNA-binding protein